MRSHQAAGTILCPIGAEADYADLARETGPMALVAVDHATDTMAADAVLLDNRAAARLATAHIAEHGHRRIAAIVGPQHLLPGSERLAGFTAALEEAGIAPDPALVRAGSFREPDAYAACLDLLGVPRRPTAIFVANNHMLVGVMRALAAAGASCPEDVSIASIDDFPWAAAFAPALTTVRQPVDEMAEAALDMLLGRIGGADHPPARLRLAPSLVVRASCRAPSGRPFRLMTERRAAMC
jgi:LacI family transcriptional regulator